MSIRKWLNWSMITFAFWLLVPLAVYFSSINDYLEQDVETPPLSPTQFRHYLEWALYAWFALGILFLICAFKSESLNAKRNKEEEEKRNAYESQLRDTIEEQAERLETMEEE